MSLDPNPTLPAESPATRSTTVSTTVSTTTVPVTALAAVPTVPITTVSTTVTTTTGPAAVPLVLDRFGPGALLTPANVVTVLRLVLSPALLVMVVREPTSWAAAGFWTVLAFSDGIDGRLARRHGTTRSGAFLDPLADKVLVMGALIALVAAGRFWVVPVALIGLREVVMSIYRAQLGRQGLAVPARTLGKVKTVIQELAVAAALFPITGDYHLAAAIILWVAVGLTWASGAQYLIDGRGAATRLGHRTSALAAAPARPS